MKKILAVLCIVFFLTAMLNSYFNKTQVALAKSVIRFHVLANSDSPRDQELKLKVRNRVIKEMEHIFEDDTDIAKAREIIADNIDKIKQIAEDEVRLNGFSYDVNVSLGKSNFPTKEYGEIELPAGEYEALKIEIGKAQGQNWWCVLFPPLCFVDENCVSYDCDSTKKLIANVGEDNANLIKKDKSPRYKIKFKSYEIWQSGKQTLAYLFGFR